MVLNKNASFVLIYLLSGAKSALEISQKIPKLTLRSIQRALVKLTDEKLIKRNGINNPKYTLRYEMILKRPHKTKLLENINRPGSSFNFDLFRWLLKTNSPTIDEILVPSKLDLQKTNQITKKEIEQLMVNLSWSSSALEGNTYSLLDTELLLISGIKAKNKTSFETQMIFNHRQAFLFIIDNPNLFTKKIKYSTVEEIHKLISFNLGIKTGIRQRLVKITASNYQPLAIPAQIRESINFSLDIINQQQNIFVKTLFAFSLIPYIQPFEDGNKRVGRMLANGLIFHSIKRGIDFIGVDAKKLALAYLSFYEFNSLRDLSQIIQTQLNLKRH